MLIDYQLSQTSIILRVKMRSTTAPYNGLTGLSNTSSGLIIAAIADDEASTTAYTSAGSTIQTIATLGTYAAPSASDCRFAKVDDTNHPGIVEIQLANARYNVSSAKSLLVSITGVSGMFDTDVTIPLRSVNPYDGVRGGMTALPSAAVGSGANSFNFTAAGNIESDIQTIKTQTVTCGSGVTVGPFVGNSTAAIGVNGSGQVVASDLKAINAVSTSSVTAVNAVQGTTVNPLFDGSSNIKANAEVVSDKTGYSLTQTFPSNFGSTVISASGVVNSNPVKWASETIPTPNQTGVPIVDVSYLLGTAWIAPGVAGTPDVNALQIGGSAPVHTGGKLWILDANGNATPTAAQITTNLLTDTTSGNYTTAGSPGLWLKNIVSVQLAGTFTTSSSSVFTTASLANAPTGGSAPTLAQIAQVVNNTTGTVWYVAGGISNVGFPTVQPLSTGSTQWMYQVIAHNANGSTVGLNVSPGVGATVTFVTTGGVITSVMTTPHAGGTGYPVSATLPLLVGDAAGTGGVVVATTNGSGVITAFSATPLAGGNGYNSGGSGTVTGATTCPGINGNQEPVGGTPNGASTQDNQLLITVPEGTLNYDVLRWSGSAWQSIALAQTGSVFTDNNLSGSTYVVPTSNTTSPGSDSNAGTSPNLPFATLGHAVSVANFGDTITLGSGWHDIGLNYIVIPDGVGVSGAGIDVTFVRSQFGYTAGNGTIVNFKPPSYGNWSDCTIDCSMHDGKYRYTFGVISGGGVTCMAVTTNRLKILGSSDGLYFKGNLVFGFTGHDLILNTTFDAIAIPTGGAGSLIELHNPTIQVQGPNDQGTFVSHGLINSSSSVVLRLYNPTIHTDGGEAGGTIYGITGAGQTEIYGGEIKTTNCTGKIYDIFASGTLPTYTLVMGTTYQSVNPASTNLVTAQAGYFDGTTSVAQTVNSGNGVPLTTTGYQTVADFVLRRSRASAEAAAESGIDALTESSLYGILGQLQQSNTVANPGFLTIFKVNGSTPLAQLPLTDQSGVNNITGISLP